MLGASDMFGVMCTVTLERGSRRGVMLERGSRRGVMLERGSRCRSHRRKDAARE